MAKNKPVTEITNTSNTVEDINAPVVQEQSVSNIVAFEDGSTRDFGKKGQIQREVVITDTHITITIYLVTGIAKTFNFEKTNPLYDTMAARGALEFIGNSVAGVYQDKEGLHPEDFNLGIEQSISNLQNGIIPTRTRGESTKGMADLIRAYCELRSEAKDENGNARFSPEDCSLEAVKKLILEADDSVNKQRLAQVSVKAKIEGYKLERQQAKAALASAKVASEPDLL